MLMRTHRVKQNGLIVLCSSHVRAQRLGEVTLTHEAYCNPSVITKQRHLLMGAVLAALFTRILEEVSIPY